MNKKIINWWAGNNSSLLISLISYYKFDSNSNDTKGVNNGTDTSISYAAGKIGNAASFGGGSSYISIADNDSLSFVSGGLDTALSFSMWIKATSTAANQWLISKRGLTTNMEYHVVLNSGGNINLALFNNGGTGGANINSLSGQGISAGSFYHYVVTYDGSATFAGIKHYINGVITTSNTNAGSGSYTAMVNGTSNLVLGTQGWALGTNSYTGLIDELGIWNKALTQAEVTNLYNSGNGKTYPF